MVLIKVVESRRAINIAIPALIPSGVVCEASHVCTPQALSGSVDAPTVSEKRTLHLEPNQGFVLVILYR